MLRPGLKSVSLMNDFMWKFSKPSGLVLDSFVATLTKSRTYLLLDKYRSFVGPGKESGGVEMSLAGLVEAYVLASC